MNITQRKEDLYSFISDASKDAQGFRVRFDYMDKTVEELEELADYWSHQVELAIEEDRQRQAEAVARFEDKVQRCMEYGAKDRATAIRWLWDAYEAEDSYAAMYGWEAFEHHHGLPYAFMAKQGYQVPPAKAA